MATSAYKKRFWLFVVMRTIANTLIILGVVFSFIAFWPFVNAEVRYWWD